MIFSCLVQTHLILLFLWDSFGDITTSITNLLSLYQPLILIKILPQTSLTLSHHFVTTKLNGLKRGLLLVDPCWHDISGCSFNCRYPFCSQWPVSFMTASLVTKGWSAWRLFVRFHHSLANYRPFWWFSLNRLSSAGRSVPLISYASGNSSVFDTTTWSHFAVPCWTGFVVQLT